MSVINDVLNDESNNDKQMIKEISVYVRNHKDKNLPFNKKFVKDVSDIVLRNSEVDFTSYYFHNRKGSVASWSGEYFKYNIAKIESLGKKLKKNFNFHIGDNQILKYYFFISTIIHEITHARQDLVREKEGNEIYYSSDILVKDFRHIYDSYHDTVLEERYANLRGDRLAYQVLTYIYPLEKIKELRRIILSDLLYAYGYLITEDQEGNEVEYEFLSAIDSYNKLTKKAHIPEIDFRIHGDASLYDRLYLGLPISEEEYDELWNLYYKMNDYEEVEDVMKLVNRI